MLDTKNGKIGRRTGVATNNSRHVAENRIIRCSSSGTLPTLIILRRDDNERDVSVAIFHGNFCPVQEILTHNNFVKLYTAKYLLRNQSLYCEK